MENKLRWGFSCIHLIFILIYYEIFFIRVDKISYCFIHLTCGTSVVHRIWWFGVGYATPHFQRSEVRACQRSLTKRLYKGRDMSRNGHRSTSSRWHGNASKLAFLEGFSHWLRYCRQLCERDASIIRLLEKFCLLFKIVPQQDNHSSEIIELQHSGNYWI